MNYWKHDGFLPLQMGDVPVHFFTFGGATAPLDDGAYYGVTRSVTQMTAGADAETTEPCLQLFATDVRHASCSLSSIHLRWTGIHSYIGTFFRRRWFNAFSRVHHCWKGDSLLLFCVIRHMLDTYIPRYTVANHFVS